MRPLLLAVGLALSGCSFQLPETQAKQVVRAAIGRMIAMDLTATLPDGLHVALCGAGGPMPAPNASGPCVAVMAGDRLFVVDAGADAARNLIRLNYPVGRIEGVLLTHFHSDHLDGLGEVATLRWVNMANTSPLPVHGPTGVTDVVEGFNRAYRFDQGYRQAHHGDTVAPVSGFGMTARPFAPPPNGSLHTVLADGDLTIEALRVSHDPVDPAVGYRFTYKDRSVLISGDTSQSANLEAFAEGVDLLVHDALSHNLVALMHEVAVEQGNPVLAKVTEDIPDYHATPKQAAESAKKAGVGHLLLYHITPPMVSSVQRPLFLDGADAIFPDLTLGQDGVSFSLPAGSDAIERTREGM